MNCDCIPEECPWVPQVSHPGDYTGPYDKSYDAWLIHTLLWLEREQATTKGMLEIKTTELGGEAGFWSLGSG